MRSVLLRLCQSIIEPNILTVRTLLLVVRSTGSTVRFTRVYVTEQKSQLVRIRQNSGSTQEPRGSFILLAGYEFAIEAIPFFASGNRIKYPQPHLLLLSRITGRTQSPDPLWEYWSSHGSNRNCNWCAWGSATLNDNVHAFGVLQNSSSCLSMFYLLWAICTKDARCFHEHSMLGFIHPWSPWS